MLLDVRTAYLLLGMLYIILPLTVFLLLKNHRQLSVQLCCAGGFAVGLGAIFLALRPVLEGVAHGFVTYTLGNALMVIGYTTRLQSLRIDIRKPLSNVWLIVSVLLFVLAYEFSRSEFGSVALRVELAYFWIGLVILFLAKTAYQYEKFFDVKQIRFIWISYLLLALALIARVPMMLLGWEQPIPFQGSFSNSLIVILAILTVIYSNLAYVGMILAKTEKERAAADKKNRSLIEKLNKQTHTIKDLMRVQAFSVLGSYGSTVVHEVLQPLTAMRFALENLKTYISKQGVDGTMQERIQSVDSSAGRAIAVIENLRNFMVEREIEIKPVSLNVVLEDVMEMVKDHAKKLRIDISLALQAPSIFVMADEHQLQRVLFNLINNAFGAIDKNPNKDALRQVIVDIKYVQRKSFVLIKIIDSGVGLLAKKESKIFEWLATSSDEGMGIGLALSKLLVESWRGHINAYDADPKVDGLSGAVFELKLQSA